LNSRSVREFGPRHFKNQKGLLPPLSPSDLEQFSMWRTPSEQNQNASSDLPIHALDRVCVKFV
jgi:hypothetical protein